MRILLISLCVVLSGAVSAFGQVTHVKEVTSEFKKQLKRGSKVISDVRFDGCLAQISLTTSEMQFRSNPRSVPTQGMAGFPTGDYGSENFSSESFLIYRTTKYSFDLAKIKKDSVSTSQLEFRGRKLASVAFTSEPDAIAVTRGKAVTFVDTFRTGIEPKAVSRVANSLRDAIAACSPAK